MWIVLHNPTSGGGKGEREARRVRDFFNSRKEKFISISGNSYEDAARKFRDTLESNQTAVTGVVVVGGDGMVHLAIQHLVNSGIPMFLVPAGTGNDFARALGRNLKEPTGDLHELFDSKPQLVDLGRAGNRFFADILSTGFDSVVNERANRFKMIKGRMKYNIAILLVLSTFKPKEYRFKVDSVDFTTKAMLIAVSNGHSYGGGMKVTPDAAIDDGLFDVMILGPVSKWEFLKVFPKVFSGAHIHHPAVKIMRGKEVSIDADAIAYADGERIGSLPINVSIVPQSLLTWRTS